MYGVDVALTRADDLDKKLLAYIEAAVLTGTAPRVLDLGCGAGGQSVRMAKAGAMVLGTDVADYTQSFNDARVGNSFAADQLQFIHADAKNIAKVLEGMTFDVVLLQRVIHYLPYNEARLLLEQLRTVSNMLYISVTGLESDIGAAYTDSEKSVADRFTTLLPDVQKTFSITEPVCLYTPEEFIALLHESGWNIEECWVSAFGNIKAICNKSIGMVY